MTPAGIELRYRRLLRWYPAGHRAVHEEEMLGVLMAGAGPGQSRPSVAQSADLLLGAARIRLRPGRALSDPSGWRDAFAVYSVAAPLLVLVSTLLGWLAAEARSGQPGLGGLSLIPALDSGPLPPSAAAWVAIGGQGVVAALALLGLRRWAAAAAAGSALYLGLTAVLHLHAPLSAGIPISLLYIPFALLAPISETVALLTASAAGRGRQLTRGRDWALLAAGSVLAATLTSDFSSGWFILGGESLHRDASLAAEFVAVLLLLALWLGSAAGKRLAFLVGVLAYGLLLTDGLIDGTGPWDAATINGSIGQVLVIVVLAAVVYRTWRRSRRARESPA